jgi:ornithine carbamoyltransferase
LTLKEAKNRLRGLKLAYVGDGNNVANTLLLGVTKLGIHFSLATPKKYRPLTRAVEIAKLNAIETGSRLELTEYPGKAVKGADAVYTDTFISMGYEKEREERLKVFLPSFQVNEELMKQANKDAIVLHCLPAHREEEITSDIIDGSQSVVWSQAENRLHVQKALLILLLLDENILPW